MAALRIIIFIFIGLISFTSFKSVAQYRSNYQGYIVTQEGDTINGKFRDCYDWYGCSVKGFRDTDGNKLKVKKSAITAYQYKDHLFIKKVLPNATRRFLRVIKTTDNVLYEYNYSTTINHIKTEHQEFYLQKDGILKRVRKGNHKSLEMMKY